MHTKLIPIANGSSSCFFISSQSSDNKYVPALLAGASVDCLLLAELDFNGVSVD